MRQPFETPLRRIPTPKGDVLHAMKMDDPGFVGFGEAYFTHIECGETKGWKRHSAMTLNLVCPSGTVRVVVFDGTEVVLDSLISPDAEHTYKRITIPPGYWVAFSGIAPGHSLVLNLASLKHAPEEAETVALATYPWPS